MTNAYVTYISNATNHKKGYYRESKSLCFEFRSLINCCRPTRNYLDLHLDRDKPKFSSLKLLSKHKDLVTYVEIYLKEIIRYVPLIL
jgi:hypothetical protein